jgi:peptidoglycan lytic transglycosylase
MRRLIKTTAATTFIAFVSFAIAGLSGSNALAQGGKASYYKLSGRTANGERFNPQGRTAAHRSLPFGTKVLVKHRRTGRSAVVRINDRGPFIRGRIIDLSLGAALAIGLTGVAEVSLVVLR